MFEDDANLNPEDLPDEDDDMEEFENNNDDIDDEKSITK
jgi:hypothetical protein